jgi:hypothetical protein
VKNQRRGGLITVKSMTDQKVQILGLGDLAVVDKLIRRVVHIHRKILIR